MKLYESIGGYYELTLNNFGSVYHDKAIAVNSGRNALEYILRAYNYNKVFIPYYSCDVLLQPIYRLGLEYEFYYIDKTLMPKLNSLKSNEVLLFINYFGLFGNDILKKIKQQFGNIIIDNSQAFYLKPLSNTPTIYSPRKFFGLPDGGFVYSEKKLDTKLEYDKSIERISHLITRIEDGAEAGYNLFKQNSKRLDNITLRYMSKLTTALLNNINFDNVRKKRNNNFKVLHKSLKEHNELTNLIEAQSIVGPMVYPFLNAENRALREKLTANKVYTAQYWPNVKEWLNDKTTHEIYLYNHLIPLPVDQRYGKEEMYFILKNIV